MESTTQIEFATSNGAAGVPAWTHIGKQVGTRTVPNKLPRPKTPMAVINDARIQIVRSIYRKYQKRFLDGV